METGKESDTISIDVNSTNFYDKVQDEVESDISRIKKSVDIVVKQIRMTAAEMEVETAALYHAELFQIIEKLNSIEDENEDVLKDMN